MLFPDGSDFRINDVVKNFQFFKPFSAFRTQFDYDNQLYLVAVEVIARISKTSYEDFIQNKILIPLQMENSYSSLSRMKDKTNLAIPHSTTSGAIKSMKSFGDQINSAAGGIYSNVHDMSKWMVLQLNYGKYGSDLKSQLFTEESQQEMWKIHTVEDTYPNPRYNFHFRGYGLGWELADVKENLSVLHTGELPGILSIVTMIPDLNIGVVILTNTENGCAGVFSLVSQTILDIYLGLSHFGWTDKYFSYFQSIESEGDSKTKVVWGKVKNSTKVSFNKTDFIGIYQDNWFGKMEVFEKENQLWMKSYRSPKLTGQLFFYNANTFTIKWIYQDMNCDAFALFSLDENGKAQSIKMKGISPNIDFSSDFQDLDLQRVK